MLLLLGALSASSKDRWHSVGYLDRIFLGWLARTTYFPARLM